MAYRAFFAVPHLTTKDGQPTNALYGFINMLLKVITDQKPDAVLVSFDRSEPTFRHEMFPEYKANREKAPDEFKSQIPLIKKFINLIGIDVIEKAGYEADDVLGTIAVTAATKNHAEESLILTGDRDVLQLVRDKVHVLLTRKGISDLVEVKPGGVGEVYKVPEELVIDFKALRGDPSDNIPGVRGVGDKTATQLLEEFGSLDNVYQNLDQIKSDKLRQKLIEQKDQAYMSRDLARIDCEVPVDFMIQPLDLNVEGAAAFLADMQLYTLMNKYLGKISSVQRKQDHEQRKPVVLIDSMAQWNELQVKLLNSKKYAFYPVTIETEKKIIGIAFAMDSALAYYVPLRHSSGNLMIDGAGLGPMFADSKGAWAELKSCFESKKIVKITVDVKLIDHILSTHSIKIEDPLTDLGLQDYLLDPDSGRHDAERIARRQGEQDLEGMKSIKSREKVKNISDIKPSILKDYAGQVCHGLLSAANQFSRKLKEEGLDSVYRDIMYPMSSILGQMEMTGIMIDVPYLKTLSDEYHRRASDLTNSIYKRADEEFNINSPAQLRDILFEKMKLPVIKKTKSGPSTDAEVLTQLAEKYDIARAILDYRQVTKLLNTYIDVLPELADKQGRIHSTFNLTVAATGRLSSSEPNLQNIPIRTEDGERIRRAFIADKNTQFIVADYSQIELRVLAHLSGDEKMIEAFGKQQDIHTATAAEIFTCSVNDVDQNMRRKAKEINFGLMYGMKAYGLAQRLQIDPKEAAEYIHIYFGKYPKVKTFLEGIIEKVKEEGYVSTLFGRKRFFPGFNQANKRDQIAMERMIMNAPMQGTAADIIQLAMIQLWNKLSGTNSRMLLQIHDELIIESPTSEVADVVPVVKQVMENVVQLDVPLTVNIGTGPNWLEAK